MSFLHIIHKTYGINRNQQQMKYNKDFFERMNFADCLGKKYQKMLIPKVDSLFLYSRGETVFFAGTLNDNHRTNIKNNRFIVNKC